MINLGEKATQNTFSDIKDSTSDVVEPLAKKARKSSAEELEETDHEDKEESGRRGDANDDTQRDSNTSSQSMDHSMENIEAVLEGRELWDRFNELGTEMIITKCGR